MEECEHDWEFQDAAHTELEAREIERLSQTPVGIIEMLDGGCMGAEFNRTKLLELGNGKHSLYTYQPKQIKEGQPIPVVHGTRKAF